MKLLLLHGPAITSSRAKLVNIKKEFLEEDMVVFEKGARIEDVLATLSTASLLSENRLVIWENPPEDLSSLKVDNSITLMFWLDHQLDEKKPTFNLVKKLKGTIINFPESKEITVFPFLDLLATRDKKAFQELEKLKKAGFDLQYFITMAFYLLRSLANPPKTPAFVKQKIEKQRKNFSQQQIIDIYKFILSLDFKIKSGFLEQGQAEFLLVQKFISPSY